MKQLRPMSFSLMLALGAAWPSPLAAQARRPPKVLVLYDAPAGTEFEKLGMAYAIMLRNLLGHFDAHSRSAAGAAVHRRQDRAATTPPSISAPTTTTRCPRLS